MNDLNNDYQGDAHNTDATDKEFPAKITAVNLSGGTYYYQWEEVDVDSSTGQYAPLDNARSGDYDPAGPTGSAPALEANNLFVPVGTYVRMKLRAVVKGDLWYDFDGGSSIWADPATLADHLGCGWVAALRRSDCLLVSALSQTGACDCSTTWPIDPIKITSTDGQTWGGDSGGGGAAGVAANCCPGVTLSTTGTLEILSQTGDCTLAGCPLTSAGGAEWQGADDSGSGVTWDVLCVSDGSQWECAVSGGGSGATVAAFSWTCCDGAGGSVVIDFTFDTVVTSICTGSAQVRVTIPCV